MTDRAKKITRYIITFAVMAILLWLSLRTINVEGESKIDFLWNAWLRCDKFYLWLMAFVSIISHIVRAMRWKMLLEPTGNHIKTSNGFLSLMTGYLVNLAVPRGGEVSRCYTLYQLEKTPIEVSFGTVVTERIADVLCLLLFIALSFFMEWEKLKTFLNTLNFSSGKPMTIPFWIWIIAALAIIFLLTIYFIRKNKKFLKIINGFKEGLLSFFRLKNKPLFVFYSLTIWGLYFLTSYLVLLAFPETAHLGFSAVVTLFAIGSIAMAAPLPGGTGSYHVLVPLGLTMLYNLAQPDAVAFVFIFHSWQTLVTIVLGITCFLVSNTMASKK
jgi:uncharacterized protein (TIRG00374 family)